MAPQRAVTKGNASATGSVRGAKVQKQRKKHKVVLESANDKDDEDKLRVVLSFHANPPRGFTFIPAGNTQLTAAMKAFAKRGGHKIMAVSATPHAARHELSREVHRIGYHFPTEVVDQVCSHYGIRLDRAGRVIGEHDNEQLFMRISQKGEVVLNENVRDQVTINTEAKEIIRDLFPKIPDNDLFQIIKTAFQLGDKKVGTAEEIPLVRRAQLSVVAHIRHSYTNYDKLLRQVPYNEARHMVEKTTLRKLVEWRGDENEHTEASKRAVDDAVREVVVLSDEEDSESELEEGQVLEKDDMDVDRIRKPARPEVITQHRSVSPGELSSGEEAPQGYRYVPPPPRRPLYPQARQDVVSRRQQSRYALWDQVRNEYQSGIPTQEAPRVLARIPLDEPPLVMQVPASRELIHEPPPSVRYIVDEPQPNRATRPSTPQRIFRGTDGRLYERMPAYQNDVITQSRIYTPPQRMPEAYSQARRSASPRARRPQYHTRTPSLNDDGSILQSIEQPDSNHQSPGMIRGSVRDQRDIRAPAHGQRRQLIDLTSAAERATENTSQYPGQLNLSKDAFAPYPSREVDMIDGNVYSRPRNIIELDPGLPTPSTISRSEYADPHGMRSMDTRALNKRQWQPNDASVVQFDVTRTATAVDSFPQRRVIYEPMDDDEFSSRPIRRIPDQGTPLNEMSQEPLYYKLEEHHRQQHQNTSTVLRDPYLTSRPPGGYIPMNAVQRSTDAGRQPVYRTTYVRQ